MNKKLLIKKIISRAKALDVLPVIRKEGSKHEVLIVGKVKVMVPRHQEISEGTTRSIMKALESELGKDWWRNA